MKARGQITIHNVRDGETAEFYRLKVVREEAVVNGEGVLNGTFSYSIEYVKGSVTTIKKGNKNELYVVCRTNTNINVPMTAGIENSGTFTLNEYVKSENRPDFFIVELKKGNEVIETRNIQVMMEAASYTKIVNDMRETVSTNGKDITSIKQDASSIKLIAEGLRTGVRNLLTGGKVEKTYHTYGYSEGKTNIKLKPNTTYTMTVSGHISADAIAKGQTLQAYIIADGWAWSAGGGNLEINTTHDVIKHYTFTTPETLPNDGVCTFDAYPTPNKMPHEANGDITVNWAVVTEGTAPAAEWLPSVEESAEERVKKVEARLENGEFKVKSDKTIFVDNSGKEVVLIENGKMSAELIDAVKLVALGIKAQTIDAEGATFTNVTVTGSINATEGRIAGFRIAGDGLINENEKGKFTNDAYVIFRNDPHSTFAGIGGNVLPASSGARAVARFENNDKTDQWGLGSNYAMILSAKNAEYNFAMVGQGHCSIRGNMEGYLAQKITLAEGNVTEIDYNKGAKVLFENSFRRSGLYLPRLSTLRNSIDAGANESFAVFIHIVQVGGTTSGDVLYGRNADVFRVVKAEETAGGRQITNQDGTKSTLTLQADGRIKNTTISSAGTAVTTMHNSGTEFRDYWMNSYSFPQIYNNDMNNVKVIAMGQGDAVTLLLSYDGNSYNAYIWSTNNRFI
jgi:hypothetical protein